MQDTVIMMHPALLPETADPEGSTRHKAKIFYEKHPSDKDRVEFYDDIDNSGRFLVCDYCVDYDTYSLEIGEGIVLRERNNQYTWWFDLIKPRVCLNEWSEDIE